MNIIHIIIHLSMKNFLKLALLSFPISLISCGEGHQGHEHHHSSKLQNQAPSDYEFIADSAQKDVKITILSDDQMKFNLREITVFEGQNITLELQHNGKINKSTMGHNWVLLKEGVAVKDFAQKAASEVERDYIPADTSDIIIHTKMLGGGEKDVITFTTPAKGTYNFLCSFAGHSAVMRGKFIVK